MSKLTLAARVLFGQPGSVVSFLPLSWEELRGSQELTSNNYQVVLPQSEVLLDKELLLAFAPSTSDAAWTPTDNVAEHGGFLKWFRVVRTMARKDYSEPLPIRFIDWTFSGNETFLLTMVTSDSSQKSSKKSSRLKSDSHSIDCMIGVGEEQHVMVSAPGLALGVQSIGGVPIELSAFVQWWQIGFTEAGASFGAARPRLSQAARESALTLGKSGLELLLVALVLAYPPNLLSMLSFWLVESRGNR
jgi:hypothetical protein